MKHFSLLLCLSALSLFACKTAQRGAPQTLAGHTLHLEVPVTVNAGTANSKTNMVTVSYRFKQGNVSEKSPGYKVLHYTYKGNNVAEATLSGDIPVVYTLTFTNRNKGILNVHRTASNGKETDAKGSFRVD